MIRQDLIEAATWALIEHDTDTADRGVTQEHYAERRADVERVIAVLAGAADEHEFRLVLYRTEDGYVHDEALFATEDEARTAYDEWVDKHYQDADDTFAIQYRRKAGVWIEFPPLDTEETDA